MNNISSNKFIRILKRLYKRIQSDEVPALGAQLTYYLILSFFPFLIILLTLVNYTAISSQDIVSQLGTVLPTEAYNIVREIINDIFSPKSDSILSFGIIATLWTSSNGVAAIIKGLNKAYDQKDTRSFLKRRGYAIIITIGLTLAILFAFTMLVFGQILGNNLFSFLGLSNLFKILWNIVRFIFPLLFLILVFIFFYKWAPNKPLHIKEVIPGAVFTTIAWILMSTAFAFYVNNFGTYTKTYGSIGGIIILLIWLYLSSIVILIGGELNATLAFDKASIIDIQNKN